MMPAAVGSNGPRSTAFEGKLAVATWVALPDESIESTSSDTGTGDCEKVSVSWPVTSCSVPLSVVDEQARGRSAAAKDAVAICGTNPGTPGCLSRPWGAN